MKWTELPKKLREILIAANKAAIKHSEMIKKADNAMADYGYDVDELRASDDAGYVGMIDYGTEWFDPEEAEVFLKR